MFIVVSNPKIHSKRKDCPMNHRKSTILALGLLSTSPLLVAQVIPAGNIIANPDVETELGTSGSPES